MKDFTWSPAENILGKFKKVLGNINNISLRKITSTIEDIFLKTRQMGYVTNGY